MDVLQTAAVLVLAACTVGPIFAAPVVLPALAVFGPLSQCARLRRQNDRMHLLLEHRVSLLPMNRRRTWWSYRQENLLLLGELTGRGIEPPPASNATEQRETLSERVYDRLTDLPVVYGIGATVLLLGVLLSDHINVW